MWIWRDKNSYTVESAYVGARRAEIEYPGGTVVSLGHDAAGNRLYQEDLRAVVLTNYKPIFSQIG